MKGFYEGVMQKFRKIHRAVFIILLVKVHYPLGFHKTEQAILIVVILYLHWTEFYTLEIYDDMLKTFAKDVPVCIAVKLCSIEIRFGWSAV